MLTRYVFYRPIVPSPPPRDILSDPSSAYGNVRPPQTSSLPRNTLPDPSIAYGILTGTSSLPPDTQPELTVGPGIAIPPRTSSLSWNTPRGSRSADNNVISFQSSSQSRDTRHRHRHRHRHLNTANIVDVSPTGRPIISSSGRDNSPINRNRNSRNRDRSRDRNNIPYSIQESPGRPSSRRPIRLSREEASLYNNSTGSRDSIQVLVPRDDPWWELDITFHRSGGISVASPGTTAISSRLRVVSDDDADNGDDDDDGISDRYYRLGRNGQGNITMRRLRLSTTPSLSSSVYSTSRRSSSQTFGSSPPPPPPTAPTWHPTGNRSYAYSQSSSSSHGHGYRHGHGHGQGHERTHSQDNDSSNNGRSSSQRRRRHHRHELAIAEAEEEEYHRRRGRDQEQQQRRRTSRRNVSSISSGGGGRRGRISNSPSLTPSLRRVLREGEEVRRTRTVTRRRSSRIRAPDRDMDRDRRVSVRYSSSVYSSSPSSSD